ncbi:MAG: hypothetical protein JST36_00200 [Bacteroidetes bacterium]|nr:hypothetical protein [Bacteroidota bacterium]
MNPGFFGASQQPSSGTPGNTNSSQTAAGRAIQSNLLLATSLCTSLDTASTKGQQKDFPSYPYAG